MTWLDAYNDIIKRAGEGYDAYLDRAEQSFWKAVSGIINSGEFDEKEIRLMENRHTRLISRDDFRQGAYNILRFWSDQAVPDPNQSPFTQHAVFRYAVELTPHTPRIMTFLQVPMSRLRSTHILASLCEDAGIRDLMWAFSYPDIIINTNQEHKPFRCYATLSTYAIPMSAKNNASEPTDNWMGFDFLTRAIEAAVKLLQTETE